MKVCSGKVIFSSRAEIKLYLCHAQLVPNASVKPVYYVMKNTTGGLLITKSGCVYCVVGIHFQTQARLIMFLK